MIDVPVGYKQTDVGVIPEDWEKKSIADIATIDGGYAFSSKNFLSSGKYQVVKMSNVYGGTLNLDRSTSYLNNLDELEEKYLLKQDDILLTLTGTTGKRDYGYSYKIKKEKNLLLNQRVARLITNKSISPDYVAFQLKMPCFLEQFFDSSKGGTGNQTNLGTQDVAAIYIPLPPTLTEQTAIATALSDVDALLNQLDKLIAKKRDIKQATMQQLLTGKKRLAGFSGEWEVKKLGDVAFFSKGKGLSKSELAVDGKYECIHYGELFTKYKESISRIYSQTNSVDDYILSQSNDVLMPTSDVTPNGLATASCLNKDGVILGGDILIIRPKKQLLDGVYFSYLVNIERDQIMQLVTGSTVYHLYGSDMATFVFAMPPSLAEQTAIATLLTDMDTEITQLQQRRHKTHALKQGMMQQLLTGKIRLVS